MMRLGTTAAMLTLLLVTIGSAGERPNILWITSEDNGPHLGCYGDQYATTPNLDELAGRGMIYRHCWSNAPVCAPARTTIISGMFPTSTGSQHMRSLTRLPEAFRMYPQYLREAGYYCTNNSKEDYNLAKPGQVWDESSGQAHWRNRRPGQPLFAIFNHTISHESQIRNKIGPSDRIHDPADVRVPAYHPDTPEVRQNWAQYYDRLTMMDARVGKTLRALHEAGLADETIIFYYGDHGSGMPRSKRWPFDSGLHVPLIVHFPKKWQHLAPPGYQAGGQTDRLVSFVDLAPTLLSIAGIEPPEHMHGQAFAGKFPAPQREFLFGFRGRMDERYDMVRTVRDKRYIYLRHYMPHLPYGKYVRYMFVTPTTRVWKQLFDDGKLNAAQSAFWQPKPSEELYDLKNDPDEVHNLADDPAHQAALQKLRQAHRQQVADIPDLGLLPEGEIHARAGGAPPYVMATDPQRFPRQEIWKAADYATDRSQRDVQPLLESLTASDSAIRYWGAMGFLIRGGKAYDQGEAALAERMQDKKPYPRLAAAEAIATHGEGKLADEALAVLLELADAENEGAYVAMAALNAIDYLDEKAASIKFQVGKLPRKHGSLMRGGGYLGNLIDKTLADLK